jgi:regulator of replication initiation timing
MHALRFMAEITGSKSYLRTPFSMRTWCRKMSVTVTKNELKQVLEKFDTVRLEFLRLRAMLISKEEASEEEKKELEKARKEIAEGSGINLENLLKELG